MNTLIPIVICGGSGTRLWPLSNLNKPKQFLKIFNNKSLFDLTIERCNLISEENLIIVASVENKKDIELSLKKNKKKATIIYEEIGRNTTAAIIFGLKKAEEANPDGSVIIMPSDHYIDDNLLFIKNIKKTEVSLGKFVWCLLGIKPIKASTGLGYIKSIGKSYIKKVEQFIEKPPKKLALSLIKMPNVFWNSGIFLGRIQQLTKSIK